MHAINPTQWHRDRRRGQESRCCPCAVFAQSEPDRTTVEVRQTSRFLRPLPADLRSVSSCHPRGSRRSFNHSRRKAEVADDAQVPAIRRCFTHGRVRYSPGRGFGSRPVSRTGSGSAWNRTAAFCMTSTSTRSRSSCSTRTYSRTSIQQASSPGWWVS